MRAWKGSREPFTAVISRVKGAGRLVPRVVRSRAAHAFLDYAAAVEKELSRHRRQTAAVKHGLGNAPAQRVVGVGGNRTSRIAHADQPAGVVVGITQGRYRAGGAADEISVVVVAPRIARRGRVLVHLKIHGARNEPVHDIGSRTARRA